MMGNGVNETRKKRSVLPYPLVMLSFCKLICKPKNKGTTCNDYSKTSDNIYIKHFPSPHLFFAFYAKDLKHIYQAKILQLFNYY